MHYVYILKSQRNGRRYTGCTSKTPEVRLAEHNHRGDDWTRQNGPFKLIYHEALPTKTEALRRERFLKSGRGRQHIDQLIPR